MANLYVTVARVRLNPALSSVPEEVLDALIASVSTAIDDKYSITGTTFPADTPADVQEACVQLVRFLYQDLSMVTEHLGDWSMSKGSLTAGIPRVITILLNPYKTAKPGPLVVKETS